MSKRLTTISIWWFIGMIFVIYGLLIGGMGIYYLSHPSPKQVIDHGNPSLWWGGIMLLVGFVFFYLNKPAVNHHDGIV